MLNALKSIWQQTAHGPASRKSHDIALAIAALMIEIMRMDGELHEAERNHLLRSIQQRFELDEQALRDLIAQAEREVDRALDIHQFTQVVIAHYPTDERIDIVADMWRMALADGHADPYEEQLIRRAAELVGLSHRQFIEAKLQALESPAP